MSISGASGAYINRSSGLPATGVVTLCGWAMQTATPASFEYMLEYASSGQAQYIELGYGGSSNLSIETNAGGSPVNFGSTPSLNTWFFWAVTNNGAGAGNCIAYWASSGATSLNSASTAGTSFTPADVRWLNSQANEWSQAKYAHIRMWTTVLTTAELLNEMNSLIPVRTANLHLWCPLWRSGDIVDYSGNGNTPSTTGSPGSSDSPPVGGSEEEDYYFVPTAAGGGSAGRFFFAGGY